MRIFKVTGARAPEKVTLVADGDRMTYTYLRAVPTGKNSGPPKEWVDWPDFLTTIDPDALRQQSDFADYSLFLRAFLPDNLNRVRNLDKNVQTLRNVFVNTLPTRAAIDTYLHTTWPGSEPMLMIAVPFADSPVEDWALIVPASAPAVVVTDLPVTLVGTFEDALAAVMPLMRIANVTHSGGVLTVPFEIVRPDGEIATGCNATVFAETSGGTLLTSRIACADGTGSAVVDTHLLEPGTPVKVKLGFKYWPGACDFTSTVPVPPAPPVIVDAPSPPSTEAAA